MAVGGKRGVIEARKERGYLPLPLYSRSIEPYPNGSLSSVSTNCIQKGKNG